MARSHPANDRLPSRAPNEAFLLVVSTCEYKRKNFVKKFDLQLTTLKRCDVLYYRCMLYHSERLIR